MDDGGADSHQYPMRDVAEVERDVVREGTRFRLGFYSLSIDATAADGALPVTGRKCKS